MGDVEHVALNAACRSVAVAARADAVRAIGVDCGAVLAPAIDQAAKLSDAERLGIFVIPQSMWSELQPANRAWTRARCKERRVLAYAALATDDDELTAEVL